MEQRTHTENRAREYIKARAAMSYLFVEVHRLLSSLVQTCLITDWLQEQYFNKIKSFLSVTQNLNNLC